MNFLKYILLIITSLHINIVEAKSDLTTAGDILQIAIPLTALATSTIKKDAQGQKEFCKSFIVNTALTFATKAALKNSQLGTRPKGGKYSFPSGHAAAAFQGAFFLQKRYGWEYGAPAIILSGFTGYTRVKGKYHHWRDVIGAAALSFGVNHFLVSKYPNQKIDISTEVSRKQAFMQINFAL